MAARSPFHCPLSAHCRFSRSALTFLRYFLCVLPKFLGFYQLLVRCNKCGLFVGSLHVLKLCYQLHESRSFRSACNVRQRTESGEQSGKILNCH